jgi:hypothetical protein
MVTSYLLTLDKGKGVIFGHWLDKFGSARNGYSVTQQLQKKIAFSILFYIFVGCSTLIKTKEFIGGTVYLQGVGMQWLPGQAGRNQFLFPRIAGHAIKKMLILT